MTDAPAQAPALGYSIVANLGGDRQITVQCFVGSDEDLASIHAKIDKAQNVIDRQRAKYSLDDIRDDLEKQRTTLARAEDDLNRIEQEFVSNKAAAEAMLVHNAEEIQKIDAAADARGRQQPVGGEAQRKKALQAENKDLVDTLAKAQAERDQHRHNVVISITRFREGVEDCEKKLAKALELVGGG